MGIATVSYTLISTAEGLRYWHPVTFGGKTFTGYLASIDRSDIPDTDGYHENHVTLITEAR